MTIWKTPTGGDDGDIDRVGHRLETFKIGKADVFSLHGSNWTNTLVPPPYDPIGFDVGRVYENGVKLEFVPMD